MERKGNFWLKGCSRCRGDLFLEELDWRCLQCGTYYYDTNPLGFLGREGVWGTNARVASYRAGSGQAGSGGAGLGKRRRGKKSADEAASV